MKKKILKINIFIILVVSILFGVNVSLKATTINDSIINENQYYSKFGALNQKIFFMFPQDNGSEIQETLSFTNGVKKSNIISQVDKNYYWNYTGDIISNGVSDKIYNSIWAFYVKNNQENISIVAYKWDLIDRKLFDSNSFQYVSETNFALTYVPVGVLVNGYQLLWSINTNEITPSIDIIYNNFNYYLMNNSAFKKVIDNYSEYNYNKGYLDSTRKTSLLADIFNPIVSFFDNFFNLEIMPNIKIGYIVLIPVIFGVIGVVLYFWRKD